MNAHSIQDHPGAADSPHAAHLSVDEHHGSGGHDAHGSHHQHAGHAGHDKHAGHDPETFRRRFWLTLVISIPVIATSEMIMDWLGYELSGVAWVGPVLGT